jgi:F-type H+-transporting ATPase subunit delta
MATETGQGVAHVYAQALYGAAKDTGVLDGVEQEIRAIRELLGKDPQFRVFLESPVIPVTEKRKVFAATLQGFSNVTLNFLSVLIEKHRMAALGEIIEEFHQYSLEQSGIAEVEVRVARSLLPDEAGRLKDILKAKLGHTIAIKQYVQPELLGGMIVTHRDHQWNGSLSHHMRILVERMAAFRVDHGMWRDMEEGEPAVI